MAAAIRTVTTLNPAITQSALNTALITAMQNAGFSLPVSNFQSGTDLITVWEYIYNPSTTFGRVFLRVRISSALVIGVQLFTGWNTGNNTGTNSSTEFTFSAIGTSNIITFTALDGGNEYRLCLLTFATSIIPIGVMFPANKPAWYDTNSWCYGWIPASASLATWRTVATAVTPFASTGINLLLANDSSLGSVNSQTNKPDIIRSPIFTTQSNVGVMGQCSSDICIGAFNGQTRLATVTPLGTSENFLIVGNNAGGIGIKLA